LVAITLVWIVVKNLINKNTEEISSLDKLTTDFQIKDRSLISLTDLQIKVHRDVGEGNISGMNFLISNGTKSYNYKVNGSIDELQTKIYKIQFYPNVSRPLTEVSIAPIFTDNKGKEKQGDIVDKEDLSKAKIDPTDNYFYDGNFEISNGAWTNQEGNQAATKSSDFSHSGSYSLKWQDNDVGQNNAISYRDLTNITDLKGKKIKVGMWYKITEIVCAGSSGYYISITTDGTGGTVNYISNQISSCSQSLLTDWKYSETEFTVPSNANYVRIYIEKYNWFSKMTSYIDNVHVEIVN
ncbi:MAG: hypothetical protein Q7R95_10290, partial [bacterium]|nr:hypothetical protein [bacterium]